MEKISIIVPVYNTVDYIEQCLRSICEQTYTCLEIICIDDGSTDGTEKILDQYAQRDNRIIVIHQENRGESNARNKGLEASTGEYIGFVDCDDWILPEMYESLLKAAVDNSAEMAASAYWKVFQHEHQLMNNVCSVTDGVFGRDTLLNYVYQRDKYQGVSAFIWCKLFKRSLLFSQGKLIYAFDENIRLGGDTLFFAQVACNTYRTIYIEQAYYHYRQRESSTVHSKNLEIWVGFLGIYQRVITYFQESKISEDIINWVRRFLAYWSSSVLEMAALQKDWNVIHICQDIMKSNQMVYEQYNVDHEDRITHFRELLQYAKGDKA